MRRLPGILLIALAILVVIVALLVSGLRLVLPHLNTWRPQVLEQVSKLAGRPVEASQLKASWENFGPTLEVRDLNTPLKTTASFPLSVSLWRSTSGRVCCIFAPSFAI